MDIEWLEDFLELAQTGVFSRAAENRNVTQPAFTRRIRKLEFWSGAELVDRSVHPTRLTSAGEKLLPVAFEVVQKLQDTRTQLKTGSREEQETIRLATLQSLAIGFFPNWIASAFEVSGTVKTKVIADNLSGCVDRLLSGSVDLMLCYSHHSAHTFDRKSAVEEKKIDTDVLVPVTALNEKGLPIHDLSAPRVPYLRYSSESFLGRVTDMVIERTNLSPRLDFLYENSMADALKGAAIAGMGVAWLPYKRVNREIADGLLAITGDASHKAEIQINLYRSPNLARRSAEVLWQSA